MNLLDAPGVDAQFINRARSLDEEITEMVDPSPGTTSVGQDEGVSEPGLFASAVTVCKLRDERTIELVEQRFGLATIDSD